MAEPHSLDDAPRPAKAVRPPRGLSEVAEPHPLDGRLDAAQSVDPLVCGVLLLGEARVALPIEVLREVIPCPLVLDALPAAAPGLLGAVRLRGRVVPVVDLRLVLGLPAPRTPTQVVVVMRHGGRLLGLLAEAVCGLVTVEAGQLGWMEPATGSDRMRPNAVDAGVRLLFTGSFDQAADAGAVSLLDAAAVMRLPGLPLLREAFDAPAAGTQRVGEVRPLLLVRCGQIALAVEVGDVHATLPTVSLLPSSLEGALCRGVIEHAGVRLPAVDTLALLELGTLPRDEPCQALLLQHGAGQVALLVSRVVDIVRVPVADLAPLAPLAVRRPAFFAAGVRVAGHGEHLLLASGALRTAPPLLALATLNTRPGEAGRAAAGATAVGAANAAPAGVEVITYDVGVEAATRLDQVVEVIAFPVDALRPASAHPAVVGTFLHRGRGVTLLCLQGLLGDGVAVAIADPDAARVLIVDVEADGFGFVVPALLHIDRAVWERAPGAGDRSARPGSAAGNGLIEVQGNGRRRTLRLVDLHAVARSLLRGASGHAAAAEAVAVAAAPALRGSAVAIA